MSEATVSHPPFDSTDLLALPALPTVVSELLAAFGDANVDIQTLAHLIGCDATISARMLTVANSAAYHGRAPRASNLERTLTILGLDTAKTIALTTAIHQTFSNLHGIPPADMDRFWRHALNCAHLTQRLAQTTAYPAPDEAYLCGLLHDIGKLVIGVRRPTALQEVFALAGSCADIPMLEQQLFGIDHCELGAALAESWRLRSFLADAIRFHHVTAENLRGAHPLLRLLHVANLISQDSELDDNAYDSADCLFGLAPAFLRQLRTESAREILPLAASLSIAKSEEDARAETSAAPSLSPCVSLNRSVQELSLVNGVQAEMNQANDEAAFLESVARCTTILFDLSEVHCFSPDPQSGLLHSRDSNGTLSEFVIDPAGAENVITRALRDRHIHYSLTEVSVSVIDRQLARLWQTEGVLCLPLYADTEFLGGLVAGVSQAQLPRLLSQHRLLHLFAAEVAKRLSALRRHEQRQNQAYEDRRLIEQQRLRAALHEVANPLTILRNYIHLLTAKLDEPSVQEDLQVLREETERVGRILLRLVDQDSDREASAIDLNAVVRDLARVMEEALCQPRGIRLILELAEGVPPLAKGGDALRQILLNLVRNAVEALGQGGAIAISSRDHVNWHGRTYVELTVADNGPGLSDEQRARLFQPTVSAKGGEHAGLGLAIVKNLTEALSGYVSCRPNRGGGLVFQVLLPRVPLSG